VIAVARIGVSGKGLWLDERGSWHFEDTTRYDFAWPHTLPPSGSSSRLLPCDIPSVSPDKSDAFLETETACRPKSAFRRGEYRHTPDSGKSKQGCASLGYANAMKDAGIEKSKFDAVLRRLINTPPQTFKETVAKPKMRKDGGIKRSAKRPRGSAS
jgi:hypothetical protein